MQILMVSPYPPYPPRSGGRTRLLNIYDGIARNHSLHLVCYRKSEDSVSAPWYGKHDGKVDMFHRASPSSIRSLIRYPLSGSIFASTYSSGNLKSRVGNLLHTGQFDIIHCVASYLFRNIPQEIDLPIVLEEPNLESLALRRHAALLKSPIRKLVYYAESLALEALETRGAQLAERYIVASQTDMAHALERISSEKIRLVPNGVDIDLYRYKQGIRSPSPLIIFLANFSYYPNVDAAKLLVTKILPLVVERIENVKLKIIGSGADHRLARLAQYPNVEVNGYTENIGAELAKAWVAVCPVRSGSGSRIKILEAMAVGTPVVSTPIGCEGLPVAGGLHLMVTDVETMASAIIEVVSDDELSERLASNSRALVEKKLTWKHSVQCLERVYGELAPHALASPTLETV